jgi:soluble cytochrome b562
VILLGSLFVIKLKETIPYLPLFYSLVALLFLFFFLWKGLRPVFARPSMERVARGLEKKFPELKDDVINSLLLFQEMRKGSPDPISETLVTAQLRKTIDEVSAIQPVEVVNYKGVLRHLRLFLPLFLAFSLVLVLDPSFLSRSLALIVHPFSHIPVRESLISVEPRGLTVLRGTPVEIKAKASGNVPDQLTLSVWPEGRDKMSFSMESEGDGKFVYRMTSVQGSFRYQAYGRYGASSVYNIQVVDPPEIGRLRLTLIPPDYTRLPKVVKEEGSIEALKGTMVNVEALVTKQVLEGKMVLNRENELLLKVEGQRLKGTLLVFTPGTYSIRMKDALGFENPNPVQYPIYLIPDKHPEGEILNPGSDLEILGNEVLPIVYTVKDDFGLTSVRLSYQLGGMERFISLKSALDRRSLGPETFRWDLASLNLTAGDRVVYRLEISDNDSVSGPKTGYSKAFTLWIRDEKARAAKDVEEAQRIADALLDLLADQLEETKDKDKLAVAMDRILKDVDRNLERMRAKEDRLDLEALRKNLASLRERISEEPKESVTREMERLSLLAEEIAKKARMNEVEALAREMRNRQRRLLDSLNDLKENLTREGLEEVLKELKKVEELLRSLMETLSQMAERLPDEFINSPEMKGLSFQEMFKELEEIRKKLSAGDIAGAMEAAQRLLQTLSEMMAAMGKAGARAGMNPFERLQREMSSQAGELERILAEQREILRETEKVDKNIRERIDEETGRRFSLSLPELERILENLKHLFPREENLARELENSLQEKRLEKFFPLARELEKDLFEKGEARRLMEEWKEKIDGLNPDPKEAMTLEDRMKFPDLSSRQGNLETRTRRLREALEMLAQLFPGLDPEVLKDMKEASGAMGEASGRLGKEDAPGAIPPEQEAIRRLTRSQESMQQMAQQMAMRMQAYRWGYPLLYDPRPGWYYGPWVPMPTLPQPEVARPMERGYTGIDREEFDVPSKDAYQVPKIYREKVLESLKEEVPSQYQREVEKYFKGLVE